MQTYKLCFLAQHCISFLLVLFLLFAGVQNAQASVNLYVTTTGAGSKDGSSWANAYDGTQLQIAINAATSGVWVAKGTYTPTATTDRTISFQMKNGVTIYGGFAGTESSVGERVTYGAGETNETILSGDIGTLGVSTDNSYHVINNASGLGLDNTAILDGFTIKLGKANGSGNYSYGGGIFNDSNSPTINNCRIISNSSSYGGGMYNNNCSPVLNNCIFSSNSATNAGGGASGSNTSATFNNCTFSSNSAGSSVGGGMSYFNSSTQTLNNCIIWGNTAGTGGKQFYSGSSTGSVTLNYSCYANGAGDVDFSTNGGTFTATNNNITSDPQFVNAGGGDYRILGVSPCVDAGSDGYNSLSYDIRGSNYPRKLLKTSSITVGTIDMGAFEYKVSADPLPVELSSFAATASNNSATLSWNTATEVNNYGFDIERRTIGANVWTKIGFVQGNGTSNAPHDYSFADTKVAAGTYAYRLKQVDNGGAFKYSQETEVSIALPSEFALSQNYPNPFNPLTVISYQLPVTNVVTLKVYDILGKEMVTLVNETKDAGSYEVKFDASRLASGVYFYRLQSGNFSSVKKLVLMK